MSDPKETTRHTIFWSVVLASFLGGILADFSFGSLEAIVSDEKRKSYTTDPYKWCNACQIDPRTGCRHPMGPHYCPLRAHPDVRRGQALAAQGDKATPDTTLPMSNRLFARRAAYMASSAAKWAADSLDLELDEPVGQSVVERFAEEMRSKLDMMERDCAGR